MLPLNYINTEKQIKTGEKKNRKKRKEITIVKVETSKIQENKQNTRCISSIYENSVDNYVIKITKRLNKMNKTSKSTKDWTQANRLEEI